MFKRILVPTDGSPLGNLALPYAADLGRRFGSSLCLVHVVEAPSTPLPIAEGTAYRHDYQAECADLRAESRRILEEGEQLLASPGTDAVCLLAEDLTVAQAITREVERQGADLVVMSTHGRTGLAHLVYGSVAEEVLRRVNVPVLLVRAGDNAANVKPRKVTKAAS